MSDLSNSYVVASNAIRSLSACIKTTSSPRILIITADNESVHWLTMLLKFLCHSCALKLCEVTGENDESFG